MKQTINPFFYVCGVLSGDGWLYSKLNRIGLRVRNREFAKKFAQNLSQFIGKKIEVHKSCCDWCVTVQSKRRFSDFRKYGMFKTDNWDESLLNLLSKIQSVKDVMSFVAGLYDSEGYRNKIYSTNLEGLIIIGQLLNKYNITSQISISYKKGSKIEIDGKEIIARKHMYFLEIIGKRSCKLFYLKIGKLALRDKAQKLRIFIKKQKKSLTIYPNEIRNVVLLLNFKGIPAYLISKISGIPKTTILNWINGHSERNRSWIIVFLTQTEPKIYSIKHFEKKWREWTKRNKKYNNCYRSALTQFRTGIFIAQISKKIGVPYRTVNSWVHGKRKPVYVYIG